ncbi:SDR family oxidoreductase [Variimorphobacter saccharofermentans]|jgi:short-subunit dehydrogenase|nr:SDR family oxidoreductase [Variimorphobacter saccharofermentans]
MKTVFITGASSGIGKETAKLFQKKGWNVVATMRKPELEKELNTYPNVRILRCDVTEVESIHNAVEATIKEFGMIDVLINNAGYYTVGSLEESSSEQIRRQIDTNLLGLIEVTKAVIPYFRKQKSGIIINLSSIAGKLSIPLQSLYNTTKFAVEGFSESLQYELEPFHIRVKLIEPGTIKTEFCGRSMIVTTKDDITEYQDYSKRVIGNLIKNGNSGSDPKFVAKTIYKAATDGKKRMRYITGKMKELVIIRKILPLRVYQKLVKMILQA